MIEPTRAERSERTAALVAELTTTTDPHEAERLRERLILLNRRVAEAVASRYDRRGIPLDDLRQVAYEGLTKAALRFDPRLRNDFLTFAVPTIRGELQRHFRDSGWAVRPPRRVQETQYQVALATDRLEHQLGREPTAAEITAAAGVSAAEYDEAMSAAGCFHPTSLDMTTDAEDGSRSLGDLIDDDEPIRRYETAEARATLTPVLRRLSERDRRIVYLRFFEDLTQEEIGADLGVTQMQVSRLLGRILTRLRGDLEVPASPAASSPGTDGAPGVHAA